MQIPTNEPVASRLAALPMAATVGAQGVPLAGPGNGSYSTCPEQNSTNRVYFGMNLPKDVAASVQDRAYTSPIWYTPG